MFNEKSGAQCAGSVSQKEKLKVKPRKEALSFNSKESDRSCSRACTSTGCLCFGTK